VNRELAPARGDAPNWRSPTPTRTQSITERRSTDAHALDSTEEQNTPREFACVNGDPDLRGTATIAPPFQSKGMSVRALLTHTRARTRAKPKPDALASSEGIRSGPGALPLDFLEIDLKSSSVHRSSEKTEVAS
jgi:hypothetical protein